MNRPLHCSPFLLFLIFRECNYMSLRKLMFGSRSALIAVSGGLQCACETTSGSIWRMSGECLLARELLTRSTEEARCEHVLQTRSLLFYMSSSHLKLKMRRSVRLGVEPLFGCRDQMLIRCQSITSLVVTGRPL
jgi:hypothetical protein